MVAAVPAEDKRTDVTKPGIATCCYHRFFGGRYPGLENDPGRRMTVWDLLDRAGALGAEGVSLEACYLPAYDAFLDRLRDALDPRGLERVRTWGHPDGLGSGAKERAEADLARHLGVARFLGAGGMRVCCGCRRTRPPPWPEHRARLLPVLRRLAGVAEDLGVIMAVENHPDLLADELMELLDAVRSPSSPRA